MRISFRSLVKMLAVLFRLTIMATPRPPSGNPPPGFSSQSGSRSNVQASISPASVSNFGRPTVGRIPSGRRTMNQLLSDYRGCFRPQTFVAFVLAALHERDFNSERNTSGIPNTIWHMMNEYFSFKELKEARQNNKALDRVLGVMKEVVWTETSVLGKLQSKISLIKKRGFHSLSRTGSMQLNQTIRTINSLEHRHIGGFD